MFIDSSITTPPAPFEGAEDRVPAASPPDERKGSAFPSTLTLIRERLRLDRWPRGIALLPAEGRCRKGEASPAHQAAKPHLFIPPLVATCAVKLQPHSRRISFF